MMNYRQLGIIAAGIIVYMAIFVSQNAYRTILVNLLVNIAAAGFGWAKLQGRRQRVVRWIPLNAVAGFHLAASFFIALLTFESVFSLTMEQARILHIAGQLSLPNPDQVMEFATTLVGGMLYAIIPTFVFVTCATIGVYDRSPSWPTFALAIFLGLVALYVFDYLIGIDPGLGDATTIRTYLHISSSGSRLVDSLVGWSIQAFSIAAVVVVVATLGWLVARFVSSAIQENFRLGDVELKEFARQAKSRYGWQFAIFVAIISGIILATMPGFSLFDVTVGILVNVLTGSLAIGFLPTSLSRGRFRVSATQVIAASHLALVYFAVILVSQEAAISDTDILINFSKLPGVNLTDQAILAMYNVVNGGLFISCVPVSILFASVLIGFYDRAPRLYAFLLGPLLGIGGMFLADPFLGIPNGLDDPELGFQVFGLSKTASSLANQIIGYVLQLSTTLLVGCAIGFFGWLVARMTTAIAASRVGNGLTP